MTCARTRSVLLITSTLMLVASIVQIGASPSAADTPVVAPRGVGYAALGDSFSSGEGTGDYAAGSDTVLNRCHRSPHAYPQLLTDDRALGQVHFAACSGAVTRDLFKKNTVNISEDPQLDAIAPGTAAVTLTIGGNDLGFASVLKDCTYDIAQAQGKPGCESRQKAVVAKRLRQFSADGSARSSQIYKLVDILAEIRIRAPKAAVYVAGYPHLFGNKLTAPCTVGLSAQTSNVTVPLYVSASDANWINSVTDSLNQVIRSSVDEATVQGQLAYYVDPTTVGLADHGRCAAAEPWINPILFGDDPNSPLPASFHPNQAGQRAYANAFEAQIRTSLPPSIIAEPFEAIRGQDYANYFQVAGARDGTWSISGDLPPGLRFDPDNFVRGTPTESGQWPVLVRFTDRQGLSDEATVVIWVRDKIEPGTVVTRSTGLQDVVDLECSTAVDCVAFAQNGLSHWDGRSWSAPVLAQQPFTPGSISCADYRWCVLVDGAGVHVTSDLRTWRNVQSGQWNSVYCLSTTACLLNGSTSDNGVPEMYLLNRTTVTRLPSSDGGPGYLSALSCVSKRFCAGVSATGRLATFRAPQQDLNGRWEVVSRMLGGSEQPFGRVFCTSAKSCIAGDDWTGSETFWNGIGWGPSVDVSPWSSPLTGAGCSSSDKTCWMLTRDGHFFRKAAPKASDTGRWSVLGTVANRLPSQNTFAGAFCDAASNCVAITQDGDAYSFNAGRWSLTGPGYPVQLPGDIVSVD